jgi:adenylyltransferase/sulfurtransferase
LKSITATALQQKLQSGEDVVMIDVREDFEHEHFNIGGILMPMGTVLQNIQNIPTDKPVIFYCEKGIRSVIVIQKLEEKFSFLNLVNLTGGMKAWRNESVH